MLTAIQLQDFKSFADARVELAPLTVLVGANASGKSNLLDALRFLQGVGLMDLPVDEALEGSWQGGREVWPGIRGGLHGVVRKGASSFTLTTSWRVPDGHELSHSLTCVTDPVPLVQAESLRRVGATDFLFEARALAQADPSVGEIKDIPTRITFPGGQRSELSARWSALERVRYFIPVSVDLPPREETIQLQFALSGMLFLEITPSRMREYVSRTASHLGTDGENLSALLYQICQDPEQKQGIVDWLSELCAPELKDIDFARTEEGDVMVALIERDGTRTLARSLSEGTLRFLGELVALRTAPEGSTILMEELGRDIHPQRLHLLIEYIESVTKARGIQVIATTHSPQVLAALSKDTLRHAVLMARRPDQTGTVMRRLADLPDLDEVLARRGIEYLFTTGWLERAL